MKENCAYATALWFMETYSISPQKAKLAVAELPVSKTWTIHSSHNEQQINPSIKIKGLRLNPHQEGATLLGRRRNCEKFEDRGWSLLRLIVPAQPQTVPCSCQAAATTVSTIPED